LLIIFLMFGCVFAIGCFIYQNRGEDYPGENLLISINID